MRIIIMNAQRAKLKRVAIFLAATSTALIPAITHADWSIMELGNLGGGTSHAYDINDSGQVVGWSDTASGDASAFITGPNGIGIINLGSLGGDIRDHSGAYGINDSGQVVGDSRSADRSGIHAFIAGPNGVGMTDLGTLGGNFSHAYDINDSGQVVGKSSITGFGHPFHAFITGPNGVGMTDLGTLG
ncbi:MAG: hypothetical protein EBU46_16010, partial [Nitrosomonadaceae bacterium]|nr:hypothetical protein [Nitrosomonadaceae bacterium]